MSTLSSKAESVKTFPASRPCPTCHHDTAFIGRRLFKNGSNYHIAEFCARCRGLIRPGTWLPRSEFSDPESLPVVEGGVQ
jgi:hypothetical protein